MDAGQKQKKAGTVFVSGLFNVLHPGHFRFLNFARNLGSELIVGVLSDDIATDATVSQKERLANISALSFVDKAILIDAPVQQFVTQLKPDTVVKGWEHHDQYNPEKNVLDGYGGKLVFSSGEISASGFGTEESGKNPALRTIQKPDAFMRRHGFTTKSLEKLLKKFEGLSVCVLGDVIVDQYVNCAPVGMSREDPTIVVRPSESLYFLGGAGIVAAHARGLGAKVHFISVCGDDQAGLFCMTKLDGYDVDCHIIKDETRPTTQKKRYRAGGKTMLRVNDYSDHPISNEISKQITEKLRSILSEIDIIIFSDFSYGALPQELVDEITKLANDKEIIIAADSQSSSQTGNVSRFKNVSLVTPTEHEARLSLNNYADGLVKLADKMRTSTHSRNVVITLAEEGLLVSSANEENVMMGDRLPALQSAALDPAGAGDALLVTAAMALAAGGTIWEAVYLGSLASAVQVSRVGNVPLQTEELREVLSQ